MITLEQLVNKKTRYKDDVRFTGAVDFDDNILVLNKDVSGTPSENAGLEIRRGTSTNAKLLWNETSDLGNRSRWNNR